MKSRFLIILGMMIFPFITPQGFAQCAINEDWSDAPCFDMGPVPKSEFKAAWMPYHDHKGAEWMESKRIEMNQALDDGTFNQWVIKVENSNAYMYFVSVDEVQNQFLYGPLFTEETSEPYIEMIILSSPIIAVGILVLLVIQRRKRK